MLDPMAWLNGLSAPVRTGWALWLAWSLALLVWHRYSRVTPQLPRAVAQRPTASAPSAGEATPPSALDQFPEEAALQASLHDAPPTDVATPDVEPAMRRAQRPSPDASAEGAVAPVRTPYQFTSHRQDETPQPQP